jgi:Protein of unknown function (DUF3592)
MNIIAKLFKIVGGMFLFAGVMFLGGAGWSGYRRYSILERWPQVDATVTECHINSRLDTSKDSDNHTTRTTVYSLDLAFRYTQGAGAAVSHVRPNHSLGHAQLRALRL